MLNQNFKIILALLVFSIVVTYYCLQLNSQLFAITSKLSSLALSISFQLSPTQESSTHKKRYVFFDLGTNNGDSVTYFIDKAQRSDKDSFLKGYGALNDKKWEIYAVEANLYFNKMLLKLKQHCESLGHTFHLFTETAAWTKNEKLVFYLDTINVQGNYWGSSLLNYHPDVVNSGYKNVTVAGIDIANFLRKYNKDDEIVMKIDIEGTEYPLLLHLIKEHLLDLVDIIAVEYHREIVKDIPIKEMEDFFKGYYRFMNIRTVPWY